MANEFKVKKGLIVDGSNTVLDVQGTSGQLFSVTDSLTGDLFSVSDVSGVPIFNVNSSGMSTFDGDVTIDKDSARLILQDTGTGNALNQWISYRDSAGTERAYLGYGSTTNSVFYVVNNLSDLKFYAGGVLNETKSGADSTFAGDVVATGNTRVIKVTNGSNNTAIQLLSDSSGDGQLRVNDSSGSTKIFFYGEANNNNYINNGGNLGIGTDNPGSKLEVKTSGTNSVVELDNSDTNYTITQYNAQGATKGFSGFNTSFMIFGGESGTDTRLQAGGQYALTIRNSDRNVGIGHTDPQNKLHVVEDTSTWEAVEIESSSTTGSGVTLVGADNGVQWSMIANASTGGAGENNLGFHLTNNGSSSEATGYKVIVRADGGTQVQADNGTPLQLTGIANGGQELRMRQSRGTIASPTNSSTNGDGNYLTSYVYANSAYASIGHIGIITGSAANNGEIQFSTASNGTVSERLRIQSNGHTLVANTRQIQFYNDDQYIMASSANDLKLGAADDLSFSSDYQRFNTGSVEHCRISGVTNQNNWIAFNNKLGIGTKTPAYKVEINDDTASGRAIQAVQSATSGTNYGFQGGAYGVGATKNIGLHITAEGATTNVAGVFVGDVGIGTDSPEAKLHVFTADASIAPNADGDELVVENSGNAGISILSGNTSNGAIFFGDAQDNNVGIIDYDHNNNSMVFTTGASTALTINSSQNATFEGDVTINSDNLTLTTAASVPLLSLETSHTSGIPIINLKGAASSQVRYQDENGTIQSRIDLLDGGAFSFIDAQSSTTYLGIDSSGNATLTRALNIIGTAATFGMSSNANQVVDIIGDAGGSSARLRIQFDSINDDLVGAAGKRTFIGDGASDIVIGTNNSLYSPNNSFISLEHDGKIRMAAGASPTLASEGLTIDTDGSVGIGTGAPSAKFEVQGTSGQLFSVTDSLTGDLFSVSDVSGIPILNVNSSGAVEVDGNLGINATPTTNAIEIDGADGTSYVYFKSAAATTGARVGLNSDDLIIENKQASGDMIFDTNSTERLRIASGGSATFAGHVGVSSGGINVDGNSMFDDNLRVNGWIKGASDTNALYSSSSLGTLLQTPGNTAGNNNSKIFFRDNLGNNKHTFDTNNGNATFTGQLTGQSYVRSLSNYQVTLDSVDSGGPKIEFGATNDWDAYGHIGHAGSEFQFGTHGRDFAWYNSTTRIMELDAGNTSEPVLAIGTSVAADNTKATLQVFGNNNTDGTVRLGPHSSKGSNFSHIHYGSNGDWYIRPASNSGNVNVLNYVAESDVRLKENIVDNEYGLNEISQLKSRNFNWISSPTDKQQTGFIAQEVEEVVSKWVTQGQGENNYKAVDYQAITSTLVKAVQELKAQNEDLLNRVKALESK